MGIVSWCSVNRSPREVAEQHILSLQWSKSRQRNWHNHTCIHHACRDEYVHECCMQRNKHIDIFHCFVESVKADLPRPCLRVARGSAWWWPFGTVMRAIIRKTPWCYLIKSRAISQECPKGTARAAQQPDTERKNISLTTRAVWGRTALSISLSLLATNRHTTGVEELEWQTKASDRKFDSFYLSRKTISADSTFSESSRLTGHGDGSHPAS